MHAVLESLIALQALDTAASLAHKRLDELPAIERALDAEAAAAALAVEAAKSQLASSNDARRALEKEVATLDGRLARFDEHKAAVKTNQEYTALLHEIATANAEKDALEERILLMMEEADGLAATLKAAQAAVTQHARDSEATRQALSAERATIEQELGQLSAARTGRAAAVEARALGMYEQLLKGRRGTAVAPMVGETCEACFVRLRPHVAQMIRRNDEIVQCESCQRILYYQAPEQAPADA